jgi:hypothetical protein
MENQTMTDTNRHWEPLDDGREYMEPEILGSILREHTKTVRFIATFCLLIGLVVGYFIGKLL